MCGIAASVDLRLQARALPWAVELLRHRGPDGEGTWRSPSGNVVLEHTRLAILDADNREADQPFLDETGRWSLVYNGELFNYRELRRELEQTGEIFRTESDTEVLLKAFLRYGRDVLTRLRGMFAFAICDGMTGEVFAARDQIGVKPLYVLEHDGMLGLCSEVRPLLRFPGFEAKLDPEAVVEFLAFGQNPSERTIVRGIRKLLPGHFMRVCDGRAATTQYWDLIAPGVSPAEPPGVDEVVERLTAAVTAAMVSDVPVGLMLSGGIDSSLIAVIAARATDPRELTAYSVAFGEPDDEAIPASRLAADLGLRFREVQVGEREVRDCFETFLEHLDYPSGNSTWLANWFIARAAHADGVKVLLSGDGGDELFGGYTRWMKYLRFHDAVWARVPPPVLRSAGAVARGRLRGLAGDIARRAAEGGDLFVTSRSFHDDDFRRTLGTTGRTALAAAPPEQAVRTLRHAYDAAGHDRDYLSWMSYLATKTSIVEDFLQRLDKMGMQHSVEGRVPLLDPDLAQWAVALPQDVRVPGGRQKALLRDAGQRLLPSYVLRRPKQGFCAPVVDWSQRLLLARADRVDGPLVQEDILRADSLRELLGSGGRAAFPAWTLAILDDWCRRNLDRVPVG